MKDLRGGLDWTGAGTEGGGGSEEDKAMGSRRRRRMRSFSLASVGRGKWKGKNCAVPLL